MSDAAAGLILTLVAENAELRQQLAHAQDLLVETAIDAGALHARLESVQAELAALRAEHAARRGGDAGGQTARPALRSA